MRVGRYGPYVQRDESETASLPPEIAPDELTVELALDLIEQQAEGPKALGDDPETGLPVYVLTGRFGPYVQLGEQEAGTKKKPKRASLFASQTPETRHARRSAAAAVAAACRSGPTPKDARSSRRPAASGRTSSAPTATRAASRPRSSCSRSRSPRRKRCSRSRSSGAAGQQKPPIAELGEHPDNGARRCASSKAASARTSLTGT